MWRVYGIVSPITKSIIYVGCTSQELERRLSQHCSDPSSSAYDAIQYLRDHGMWPSIVCIEDFTDASEALLFETRMITSIKGLVNRQHQKARDRLAVAAMLEDDEIEEMKAGGDVVLRGWRKQGSIDPVSILVAGLSDVLLPEPPNPALRPGRGRPKSIDDMKAYKAAKQREYRLRQKEAGK